MFEHYEKVMRALIMAYTEIGKSEPFHGGKADLLKLQILDAISAMAAGAATYFTFKEEDENGQ